MADSLRIRVRIEGVHEILAAARRLPPEAQRLLRDRSQQLAETLAVQIRAAGQAESRQAARAARSVKARRDRVPVVSAGGTKAASAVLFGSEFGMTRRSGWYARGRYHNSAGRQFKPHRGAQSYWFFKTAEREEGRIGRAYQQMADELIRSWRA